MAAADPDIRPDAPPEPGYGLWAVVEIMGHRIRAGLLSDATIGGATLLRIAHPSRADHTGGEPLCEYYAPTAIFAIRPCSRDDAEKVAAHAWPAPIAARAELAPVFQDFIDDDYGDEDDD